MDAMSLHHDCAGFDDCAACAWRAQAEALAGALQEVSLGRGPFDRDHLKHADNCIDAMKEVARSALARLPAQALAERRALEAERDRCRSALVSLIAILRKQWPGATMDHSHIPPSMRGAFRDAVAALDATRGEGGA